MNKILIAIIGFLMIIMTIKLASATTPKILSYQFNYSDLPISNETIITITGEIGETFNLIYDSGSFVNGVEEITFSSGQSQGNYVFNYTIPINTSVGDYTNAIILNKTTIESIIFNFEILNDTVEEEEFEFNYTGSCLILNFDQSPNFHYNLNVSDLAFNENTCVLLYSEGDKNYSINYDSWLSGNSNWYFNETNFQEFNITIHIPVFSITIPEKNYRKDVLIYGGGYSKVINYYFTVYNPDYVYENNSDDIDYNDSLILESLENLTALELLQLIKDYEKLENETRPRYIVKMNNQTEYVSIPLSAELMERWIKENDPAERDRLQQELDEWKSKYGEEESDNEYTKELLTDEKEENTELKKQLNVTTASLIDKNEKLKKSFNDQVKYVLYTFFGIVGFIGLIFLLRWRMVNLSDQIG